MDLSSQKVVIAFETGYKSYIAINKNYNLSNKVFILKNNNYLLIDIIRL